jgi:hypothetical protein
VNIAENNRYRVRVVTVLCSIALILAFSWSIFGQSFAGYGVRGYMVYTIFDTNSVALRKEVRLFEAKVRSPQWLIRTEPFEQSKDRVSYWEGGGGGSETAILTVLSSAAVVGRSTLAVC